MGYSFELDCLIFFKIEVTTKPNFPPNLKYLGFFFSGLSQDLPVFNSLLVFLILRSIEKMVRFVCLFLYKYFRYIISLPLILCLIKNGSIVYKYELYIHVYMCCECVYMYMNNCEYISDSLITLESLLKAVVFVEF